MMLSAPDDYGLDEAQTLAHRAEADRPEGFDACWLAAREAAAALPDRFTDAPAQGGGLVILRSIGDVRLAGTLHWPARAPRGGMLAVRADAQASDPRAIEAWLERDLAVLELFVRGFGGSAPEIAVAPGEWILHHVGAPHEWIVHGAVIDLLVGFRALRRRLGATLPIALHGTGLGGGLAVIAAAQLEHMGEPPHRLVVAHPDLGDWRWRAGRYCNGAGALVNMMLDAMRERAPQLLETLRLCDAALHAADVRTPVLCKLAACDDTVPAPAAAAVFNALGSTARGRFATRYGHYDGGIADARRHARFEEIHPAFADPEQPPAIEPSDDPGPGDRP